MTDSRALRERARDMIATLHTIVEELTAPLQQLHADRMQCQRGCAGCCIDDLTIFEVEAAHITHATQHALRGAEPAPPGRCAFLDDEGACRIYANRPYVCRTQGLPLRWVEEDPVTLEVMEYRDICPLNLDEERPLAHLSKDELWSIGPLENKLSELQHAYDPSSPMGRKPLRELFAELSKKSDQDA